MSEYISISCYQNKNETKLNVWAISALGKTSTCDIVMKGKKEVVVHGKNPHPQNENMEIPHTEDPSMGVKLATSPLNTPLLLNLN